MKKRNYYPVIAFFFLVISCTADKKADVQWNYGKTEITGDAAASTEKLEVDIYLDATTSMKGFVSNTTTDYSRMLDDIESTCQNVWKNTDIRYFKFGRQVDSIGRSEFVAAKTSPAMYSDPQLSTQTNFAEAVEKTDAKRVSIFITDFFYNNNDVNLVVRSFKKSFQNGADVGIAGFSSAFDGVVADVKPAVRVNGPRPAYVLIFGDRQNINLFFNILKSKPYINQNQFLLLTGKPSVNFEVNVTKDKSSKSVNKYATKEQLQNYGTVYTFRMKPADKDALFNAEVKLSPAAYTFPYTEKNIKAYAFKKTGGDKDSVAAGDEIKLTGATFSKGVYKANVALENTGKEGLYSYAVYLVLDNVATPVMPDWVNDVSADTYGQGTNENKTLNLHRLLTDIATNQLTDVQPKLAKFYLNVEKK